MKENEKLKREAKVASDTWSMNSIAWNCYYWGYGLILLGMSLIGYSINGLSGVFVIFFCGLIILLGVYLLKRSIHISNNIIMQRYRRNLALNKFKNALRKYRNIEDMWRMYGYEQAPNNQEKAHVEFEKDLAKYELIEEEINLAMEIGDRKFHKYREILHKKRDKIKDKLIKKWNFDPEDKWVDHDPDPLDYIDLLDIDE